MSGRAWLAGGFGLGAVAGLAAYGGWFYTSQIFGPTIVAPHAPGEIFLSFDDGPNPLVTPRLLDVLSRRGVRATFFLIGRYVRTEGPLVRAIAARGHALGNHTFTHPKLGLRSARRIREELGASSAAIEDATGAPVRLFRPPHGERRPAVIRIAHELGMRTMMWNVMVGDWQPIPAARIEERLSRARARNGRRHRTSGIVLHDGGQHGLGAPRLPTVEAVDALLARESFRHSFVLP